MYTYAHMKMHTCSHTDTLKYIQVYICKYIYVFVHNNSYANK